MFSIADAEYSPTLRGKPGELEALYRVWPPIKRMVAPTIVLPALSIRDLLKRRPLTKKEAPRIYANRIARSWKGLPFFLEARFLKFDTDPVDDASHLHKLLSFIEKSDCRAIPVIDARTNDDRMKAYQTYAARTGSGIAFRCVLADLDRPTTEQKTLNILKAFEVDFSGAALILDLSDAAMIGIPEVAALIVQSYSRLVELGAWGKIVIAASSYPEKIPAEPNRHAVVRRLEWAAWKEAARLDDRIKRNSIFGDFGADHGKLVFGDARSRAVPHWRYCTPESWVITRGSDNPKEQNSSMRLAAARIINLDYFAGDRFSWGDEFLSDCASEAGRPGNPTTWRAVNMNHHITRALADISSFYGRTFNQPSERQTAFQEALQL